MTADRPMAEQAKEIEARLGEFNPFDPDNIAPLVVWLATDAAKDVTGRVFDVSGGRVGVAEPWSRGPAQDKGSRWEVGELDRVVPDLIAQAASGVKLKPEIG